MVVRGQIVYFSWFSHIFLIMAVGGDIEAYEVKAAAENGNVISSLYKH